MSACVFSDVSAPVDICVFSKIQAQITDNAFGGIICELNASLTYTTLAPKRSYGFRGGCITKNTKGITLITVTSHTPTQTVSRMAARGSTLPSLVS